MNEIGLDGEVLHLTSLQPESNSVDNAVDLTSPSEAGFEEFLGRLREVVDEEEAEKLRLLKDQSSGQDHIQIGPINDKKQRTVRQELVFCNNRSNLC